MLISLSDIILLIFILTLSLRSIICKQSIPTISSDLQCCIMTSVKLVNMQNTEKIFQKRKSENFLLVLSIIDLVLPFLRMEISENFDFPTKKLKKFSGILENIILQERFFSEIHRTEKKDLENFSLKRDLRE